MRPSRSMRRSHPVRRPWREGPIRRGGRRMSDMTDRYGAAAVPAAHGAGSVSAGTASAEIYINVGPRETRAALIENGALQELHVERASRRGLVGNLYKGRVSRVLPGMQAAFVDVGLERTAFLHVADIALARPEDTIVSLPAVDDIRRLVSEGDEILVQVVKDPIGTKGARLTTFIALPSRHLVYLPRGEGIGVSARIEEVRERARLKSAAASLPQPGAHGGYNVRTAAQGATVESLREDMSYLARLWEHVRARAAEAAPGTIVHEDLPLTLRILRDELARGVGRVLVDCPREHARMAEFASAFLGSGRSSICTVSRRRPRGRSIGRCRSNRGATSSSIRPKR